MTGSSKNNRENYPRKCFWTQEKETRVKFNPGLSANRPSNNWALVSGCPELAKTEYINPHNKAAAHMHRKICKEFGIEVKEQWYEYEPKTLIKNDSVSILWDMRIHTDRNIAANRLDIVLKNIKDKTCLLIEMTIPLDTNTSVKTTEKINKI